VDGLTTAETDFLDALRRGETGNGYARRLSYSESWAKQKSRRIKQKLGVSTIGEAIAMSSTESENGGVSRSDFEKLTGLIGKLASSIEDLVERPDSNAAQQNVVQRELDVKDHAKALGLSVDDVSKLLEEKDYERFRKMQDRLDAERAATDESGGDDDDDDEQSGGVLDGLGGIGNLVRGKRP
jgi:hypothetical protein